MSTKRDGNQGSVISVRGSVIDVRFPTRLPEINHLLEVGQKRELISEVITHLDVESVRSMPLTPRLGGPMGMQFLTPADRCGSQ